MHADAYIVKAIVVSKLVFTTGARVRAAATSVAATGVSSFIPSDPL
jgi:hypothetical protein